MTDATPASDADLLLPKLLEPRIAGTIFAGGLHHFARIGSTNAAAMQAGAERWARGGQRSEKQTQDQRPHPSKESLDGAPAGEDGYAAATNAAPPQQRSCWGPRAPAAGARGEVWLAEEQTAGKGRAGHLWQSRPHEGIYLSALLRPRLTPAETVLLSLAAGLAVVEAVHEVTGRWADLRWPNDVLLGEKKFCGILAELNADLDRVRYVVVGMGLNVNNQSFSPELEPIATSLRLELGRKVSRVELVAALLRALDRELAAFEGGGSATREQVLRRFERHSSFCCGAAVTVEEDGGYQGITRGLDPHGFLRVETTQGMRTVLSGGVRKK